MPKVIQNGPQFSGVAMRLLGSNGWMGVPPVNGQAVVPEALTLQDMSRLNTGIKTMHFTSVVGHADLKLGVVASQPGEREEDGSQHTKAGSDAKSVGLAK